MHLFLTGVLPFLAHNHPSAAAFLTCRYHNFHASIVPEFLSEDERVKSFCTARQKNELEADKRKQYANLYSLFVQTPLMQFSPSVVIPSLRWPECRESIIKPLLETKYFARSLQRCYVDTALFTNDILQGLSKVQSLTELEFSFCEPKNEHLEIIIKSFPSIETLTIYNAKHLRLVHPTAAAFIISPPPPATKILRSLRLDDVDALFATHLVSHCTNLRKLVLCALKVSFERLDTHLLSSSLPLLTDLSLEFFILDNSESLQNLVHLSSVEFKWCHLPHDNLVFLTQENCLPHLSALTVHFCYGVATSSFASLVHAPNLHTLGLNADEFNNDCLQYLDKMVHLRKLDLSHTEIVGDSRMLKTLMENLFQLEELNLRGCLIGNQGAIAGALYSTHSRLRDLKLGDCDLVDDDLNGIGALKSTLEILDLGDNNKLTNESLVHCKDLVTLKSLSLKYCYSITDLSRLKDCLSLEELDVSGCEALVDDSFKVFSEEPNSFPNLRRLSLVDCGNLTVNTFEHLSKNNHLVYQLKELDVEGMCKIFSSSPTARNSLYQLKGLRLLDGFLSCFESDSEKSIIKDELMPNLKNLDVIV